MSRNFNTTWLWNTTQLDLHGCNSDVVCTTVAGGLYDERSSPSATGVIGSDLVLDSHAQGGYALDTLSINGSLNASLPRYPVGMVGWTDQLAQNTLGLGQSSTFLNVLINKGFVASRSWSFFWGLFGGDASTTMEGALTIGGYDVAKIADKDNNFTSALGYFDKCPSGLTITVSDMILNFPNGTNASMLGKATGITACLGPESEHVISIPNTWFNTFETLTNTHNTGNRSQGFNFWNVKYPPNAVYGGDITFQFSPTFKVRIPNSQLVVPDLTYDTTTGMQVSNPSSPVLMINPMTGVNENDTPTIGRQFFSAAQLFVDLDRQQFTLWNANVTKESNLKTVFNSTETQSRYCSTTTTPATPIPTGLGNASGRRALQIGGTVAIVVASLFAAAIAYWLFICIRRRRRRIGTAVSTEAPPEPDWATKPKFNTTMGELDARGQREELPAGYGRHEVEGGKNKDGKGGMQPVEIG